MISRTIQILWNYFTNGIQKRISCLYIWHICSKFGKHLNKGFSRRGGRCFIKSFHNISVKRFILSDWIRMVGDLLILSLSSIIINSARVVCCTFTHYHKIIMSPLYHHHVSDRWFHIKNTGCTVTPRSNWSRIQTGILPLPKYT